jgi:pimeloyl-ACP methyl ester carboxylesterase
MPPPNNALEKKYVETGSGKICYFVQKSFAGRPTVVFLHGLSSNHTTWMEVMTAMNARGFDCLALDLRGHGFSDKTKRRSHYTLPVFSKDLAYVLAQERIGHYILVGYSFGGSIALDYAARYGNENLCALVLISTNYQSPFKYKHIGFLAFPYYALLHIAAFLLLWQGRKTYYYYQHGTAVGYWSSVLDGLKTMPLSINYWMLSEMVLLDLTGVIRNIRTKTIIINSLADVFISKRETREMQELIPGAQVVFLKHKSHFLASNYQREVLDIMTAFLADNV